MAKFSIESKVGDLMKDAQAKAVLEQFMPGISTNPQTRMAYGMTLKALSAFPQAKLNKDLLAKIDAALQALG